MNAAGYHLLREQDIPELSTHARLLRHGATGAQVLSLENADENKAFGISFFTPPPDASGVAHILEHSVLCGSRKFPAKEPYVELRKSSLNTYLNASTSPDKTCFPVASQNVRDFYNLIDVYLDAVFFPRLSPHTLQQEGWHFELDAADAPLRYKGVVLNEMKGRYSSPDILIHGFSQQAVFPDTPYSFDSGGDPRIIPTLTWETFKRFHETYYHPSNAFIFFSGDDAPDQRLRLLAEYLDQFSAAPVPQGITPQPPFTAPRRFVRFYDPGAGAEPATAYVAVNWRLTPNDDPERTLGLAILSYALLGAPASPLRKALIDSGLGEAVIGGGLRTGYQTAMFSAGLKGVAPEQTSRIEPLILETLQRLVSDGFDDATIQAALNTTEFRLREQNTGAFPRGLSQMLTALTRWLYGFDPLQALAFSAPLASIKERLMRGEHYLEQLLQTYLMETQQRATVELLPEVGFAAQLSAAEAEHLAQIKASMSAEALHATIADTAELRRRQATPDPPEALAALPSLTLADMERSSKLIPLEREHDQDATILFHELPTNGITYLVLGLDLHVLPPHLLPYVGLLRKALLTMGTERENYGALSQRIDRETGGFAVGAFASMTQQPGAPAAARLFLRGKATSERVPQLVAIARDILTALNLDDRDRFRQIVLEEKARLEGNIVRDGSTYAALRLRSAFHEAAWASEQWGGITYLLFLQDLAVRIETDWPALHELLHQTWQTLLTRQRVVADVAVDGASWPAVRPVVRELLAALPATSVPPAEWHLPKDAGHEGFAVPTLVNFMAKGINLMDHGYAVHGSFLAITNWLRTAYLWDHVRVQGGAYGASAGFDDTAGFLTFSSFRDPNLVRTLATFDAAAEALRTVDLTHQELERSVIGAIGALDAYQLPDAKASKSLVRTLIGTTDALRQQRRDELLATSLRDFHRFGDFLGALREQGRVVVLGSLDALEAANAAQPGWLHVTELAL